MTWRPAVRRFSLSQDLLREQPVQAATRQQLRALLANRPSGGIVFATIQKFMPGEDEDSFPELSDRSNIVVIADEAHRTQYGFEAKLKQQKRRDGAARGGYEVAQAATVYDLTADNADTTALTAQFAESERYTYQAGYAQHLRDALPSATFVAFTGTPVSSTDRDTRSVFAITSMSMTCSRPRKTAFSRHLLRIAPGQTQAQGNRPGSHRREVDELARTRKSRPRPV